MKFILKIILFISFFTSSLLANLPKIDECKTDLYYANGILIKESKKKAKISWNIKAKTLFLNNQEAFSKLGKIDISYNTSYGTASDLFEAFLQKVEGEVGFKVTWEAFKFFIKQKLKHADDLLSLAANASNSIENYDLTTQVNAYKNSIKSGHGVIVISHSQGNLFTNRAYAKLDEWMKPYFHNMGVATPADEVASNGPYVTFDNDPIHHIPGALDDNLYNQNRYYSHTNALGEKVEALTGAFHSFDYYLGLPVLVNDVSISSNQAAEKIKSFILEKIQAHANAPSQWETDQEFEKNTENYRISVKHRFDSSIITMDGEEVFPFAPSKKLYYVQGEFPEDISGYVKASFGGTEILDDWTNKKAYEVYLLNETDEKIIISMDCLDGYHYDIATGTCVINDFIPNISGQISGSWTGPFFDPPIVTPCSPDVISFSSFGGVAYGAIFTPFGNIVSCETGSVFYKDFSQDNAAWRERVCENVKNSYLTIKANLIPYLDSLYNSYDLSYGAYNENHCNTNGGHHEQTFRVVNIIPK